MKVLILGCGPAGLIAATSAVGMGEDVKIMSNPRKSFMNGAQYLHQPIPGVSCGEPFNVDYRLEGTAIAYRTKVYGKNWDGAVSPEDLAESHLGWDIRTAYDHMWETFEDSIIDWEATPGGLKEMMRRSQPDLVVSTIPAPLLCSKGHTFRSTRIWSTDRSMCDIEDNQVVCNGYQSPRWYRASRINGFENTEWPDGAKPPIVPLWEVLKPTDNNCDCFPTVIRGGRYGNWKKGVLSHEIYKEVEKECLTFQDGLF